jgi:putative ABC transport system substrate-binding protein
MAGIGLDVLPEEQFSLLKEFAPGVRKVGAVYSPENSSAYVSRLSVAAKREGVELDARPATDSQEALEVLHVLAESVDAFMMIPDATTSTDRCFEQMLLLGLRRKIPVFALSPKYVAKGALVAPVLDYRDIGKQAGGVLVQLINGRKPHEFTYMRPRKVRFVLNASTAERIGIEVPHHLFAQAAEVYE